ncbi:MAG: hypothetical protein AAGA96_00780 [Verrucomicrobiota bacterium]
MHGTSADRAEGVDSCKTDVRADDTDAFGGCWPLGKIEASFAFSDDFCGRLVSRQRQHAWLARWGIVLVGTKRTVFVEARHHSGIEVLKGR